MSEFIALVCVVVKIMYFKGVDLSITIPDSASSSTMFLKDSLKVTNWSVWVSVAESMFEFPSQSGSLSAETALTLKATFSSTRLASTQDVVLGEMFAELPGFHNWTHLPGSRLSSKDTYRSMSPLPSASIPITPTAPNVGLLPGAVTRNRYPISLAPSS